MIRDTEGRLPARWYGVPTLRALHDGVGQYNLTGSHYFGCAKPESDFDFCAKDTPLVRRELAEAGFVSIVNKEYGLRSGTTDIFQKGDVQVQLSADVSKLLAARDILRTHLAEEHRKADAEERNYLWGTLVDLLSFKAGTFGAFALVLLALSACCRPADKPALAPVPCEESLLCHATPSPGMRDPRQVIITEEAR